MYQLQISNFLTMQHMFIYVSKRMSQYTYVFCIRNWKLFFFFCSVKKEKVITTIAKTKSKRIWIKLIAMPCLTTTASSNWNPTNPWSKRWRKVNTWLKESKKQGWSQHRRIKSIAITMRRKRTDVGTNSTSRIQTKKSCCYCRKQMYWISYNIIIDYRTFNIWILYETNVVN